MTHSYLRAARVFLQFMRRDAYIQIQQVGSYIVNYVFIYPIAFSIETAYLQGNTYFTSSDTRMCTLLFCGYILIIIMVFTYKQCIELIFDLENQRFVDYQMSMLNPSLVIIQRIFFTSILTWLISLPFYPVGKLTVPTYIDTSNTSWWRVIILLYLSALGCSAYHMLATLLLKRSADINTIWARANLILIDFGGLWIPWFVLHQYSPIIGYFAYLNPLLYMTEGLKGAILGSSEFLSFPLCILMLIVFSIGLTAASCAVFKKRVDCL